MRVDFSDHPMFKAGGFSAPTRFEADIYDVEVEGEIPSGIHGVWYRMACDYRYPPPKNDWATGFNGDGHVTALFFKDGRARLKSRYVGTERLHAEAAVRRRLFGVYRNRYTNDPSLSKLKSLTAANTHIYWHGGRLFTLKEDSLPFEIDPYTLEAKGSWDFHGKYSAVCMSAHPKIDPVTGEMICYGYQAKGDLTNDIAVYTVAPSGHITKEVWLKMPYVGMIHDICLTQKHIVFPVVGNVTSLARLHAGEPMWEWDITKPTMVGILPRDGEAKDVRWFKGPNRSTLHFMNAVTHGDKVVMELPVGDKPGAPQLVRRWTFDLNSKDDNFGEDPMVISPGLLPRMDDRYLSMPYQYGFVGARDPSGKRNVYNKFDIHKGIVGTWIAPETTGSLQENTFIPRSAKSPEGDGYVIGVGATTAEMESEIYIIDSMRMEQGPVATIKLPFRLRSGTHTNWFPAPQIPV